MCPVRIPALGRCRGILAAALLAGGLPGCSAIGGLSGAAAGIATGAATTNPAVGVGVGIVVHGAVNEAINHAFRTLHQEQQDHIAAVAGGLAIDQSHSWEIENRIPYGNEHGQVRVLGEIVNPLARCRAVLFSVEDPQPRWFEGKICRHSSGRWKWATAEPATGRWGSLH